MFDPKEVAAYRSISAPETLGDRIFATLDSAPRKKSPLSYMKWVSTAAACLVLVLVLSVFAANDFGNFTVSTEGGELARERMTSSEPVGYSLAEENGEITIALWIEGKATLSVSDGTLRALDETETLLFEGTEYGTSGKTLVRWTVCTEDITKTFEFTARGAFKTETLLFAFDEDQGQWLLTLANED